jgi:hypothetical protein
LLAARAPKLRTALRKAKRDGMAYVIIDGTLIPIDRVAADRPFYSGKHKMHGMNLQVIASPDGSILWVSGDLPGSTHDTAAARIWQILAALVPTRSHTADTRQLALSAWPVTLSTCRTGLPPPHGCPIDAGTAS